MTGFLYFIPNAERQTVATPADANKYHLGHVAECPGQLGNRRVTGTGPSGTPGLIVHDPTVIAPGRAKYLPGSSKQRWQKAIGGLYWVGVYVDEMPDLAAYRRSDSLPGGQVTLDNDQAITLPMAVECYLDEDEAEVYPLTALPWMLGLTEDGEVALGSVKSRYRKLWRLAMDYAAAESEARQEAIEAEKDTFRFLFERTDELMDCMLTTNYRFGLTELIVAEGYDVQFRQRATEILLDADGWERLQKKRAELLATRESGSSFDGPPESNEGGTAEDTGLASRIGEATQPESTVTAQ